MMTPLCRVTTGGDHEKTTCLCPANTSNVSGAPSGAENSRKKSKKYTYIPVSGSDYRNKTVCFTCKKQTVFL